MDFSCEGIRSNIDQRYEVLLQMAPFGFLLIDLAGNILEVNNPALKILGSPSEDATKTINMLAFKPLEGVGISQLIRDAISQQGPLTRVFSYTSCWGRSSRMKCTACSIRDSTDSVCFIAFLIEDTTELEKMKDKYYRMARTLASVVDNIKSHFIWCKDNEGVYQVASKSYSDLFFKTPMEIVGLTDYHLYDKGMADSFKEDDLEVLSTCGLKEINEIVETPKCGKRRWRTIKTAICDLKGLGSLTVGIAEDVTEEYERREAAKKAIIELEAFIERQSKNV